MALMAGLPPVRVLIFLIIAVHLIDSHNVPVFIWGSNSHSPLTGLSALSHVSSDQFKEDYLKRILSPSHKVPVVVFIQDRLSLEDWSVHGNGLTPQGHNYNHLQRYLDEAPSLTLQSVEDPFLVIRDVKGHQTIQTRDYNDDIRQLLSELTSHLTLVYLPPTVGCDNRPEALKANDEMMSKAISHISSKGYIAIFTGKEPSWDAASEEAAHRRIARGLLAVAEEDLSNTTFAVYFEYIRVKLVNSTGDLVMNDTLLEPTTIATSVDNNTVLTTWTFSSTPFFESFDMSLLFRKAASYWKAVEMEATFKDTEEKTVQNANLTSNFDITAGNGFSFSCSNVVLKGKANNSTIYLTLHKFQVEPFSTQPNITVKPFSDSFHCSTFFTLPIWMGFFTLLLFTVILGIGIFMLFQVKTTDRFDDPKGKTITVPQSE